MQHQVQHSGVSTVALKRKHQSHCKHATTIRLQLRHSSYKKIKGVTAIIACAPSDQDWHQIQYGSSNVFTPGKKEKNGAHVGFPEDISHSSWHGVLHKWFTNTPSTKTTRSDYGKHGMKAPPMTSQRNSSR
uniref:Uncharacterized protein n=1 Tax=Rhipicephalus zambeziensis TaxID=60191 RepID=A0A224YIY8_9ACAR